MNITNGRDRQKLQIMRQTVGSTPQPLLAVNPDGSVIASNESVCQLLGLSPQEIENLKKTASDFHRCITEVIDEIRLAGLCSQRVLKYDHRDDRTVFLYMSVFKELDHDGRVEYYYCSLHDITGSKIVERNYRLIVENAYDLITIIDPLTLCYKYVSPSHERVMGYSPEEWIGTNCFNYMHPDDLKKTMEILREGIKKGSGIAQYRTQRKDGAYVWLEAIGKMIKNDQEQADILLVTREISEKKLSELALKTSEEKYRLIVDNAFDGISIIDPATLTRTYINPSLEKMLGYTPEEQDTKHLLDYVYEEDRDMVEAAFLKGMQEGEGRIQCRLRKEGGFFWSEITGKVMNKDTSHAQLLFINRNIDERKNTEQMLRRSEEKYRLIADNSMDIISLIQPGPLQFAYLSPSITRVLGFSEEELIGTDILNLVHPEDLYHTRQVLNESFAEDMGKAQYRCLKKDGSYIWMESIGKMINNVDGFPTILLTSRDINQRKLSEEALMASEERLRRSEEELKQQLDYVNYLINNMNEVFVLYDNKQHITFVNSSSAEPMGYPRDELIGRNILDFVAEADKNQIIQRIEECIEKSRQAAFEATLIRNDGGEAQARIKSSPIIGGGKIQGGMLLIEDISEHRKIEKEMARLDQLNTVGEMAAGIGHEIRNPMTAVKGFLQMLSQYEEYAHHQHYFELMLEELERANAIISEFLSLAKNKLVNLQPHNLNAIVSNLFPLLQADAHLTEKTLVMDLKDIPELLLDEKEIRQLVINLVRNGMEAMAPGGTVTIQTRLDGEDVILDVCDQGKGIPPQILDRLGTPFLTTKEKGTGLGLAICYSIVARHGATIEPISTPYGTTVQVCFKPPQLIRQMGLPW